MKIYSRQFIRLVYLNKDNNKIGKSKRLSEENSLVDSFSQTISNFHNRTRTAAEAESRASIEDIEAEASNEVASIAKQYAYATIAIQRR